MPPVIKLSRGFRIITLAFITLWASCQSTQSMLKRINSDQWEQVQADNLQLYYMKGSVIEKDTTDYLIRVKESFEKAQQFSQIDYRDPIHIILLEETQEIEDLIGLTTDGIAFPQQRTLVEIIGVTGTCHEKFHLLSIDTWGMPKQWISEGMAVYCDDEWWGNDLHALAHYLLINDKELTPAALQKDKFFAQINSLYSYPLCGSLVKYIDEVYGRAKVLALWQDNDFEKAIGKTPEVVLNEWQEYIRQFPVERLDYLNRF